MRLSKKMNTSEKLVQTHVMLIFMLALITAEGCAVRLSPDPFYLLDKPDFILRTANIHGGLQLGKVYWQNEVWIDNVRYFHALGMHPPDNGIGYAEFRIPNGAKYFQSVFGLARQDTSPTSYGNAAGRIYLDGNPAWEATVSGANLVRSARIPIPVGAKILRLEVDSLGTNWSDQTTWGDPYFTGSP